MEFLAGLFGDPVPPAVKLVFLTIVLVLILLFVFWVFRKFVGSPAIKATRGRQPRLAVTDAANLDDKRRLVLVRRDDVEHLVMIGGATDILIESNIVRAISSRPVMSPAQTSVEPETVIEPVVKKTDPVARAAVAAGAVVASALVIPNKKTENTTVSIADKEITTVAEIKEAAMADLSLDTDDLEIADISLDLDIEEPIEDTGTVNTTFSPAPDDQEMAIQTPEVEIPELKASEIEPSALSGLEDALGEELSGVGIDTGVQIPVEPVSNSNPVTSTDIKPDSAPKEKPDMEDEMQKLLDELSGEKA